MRMLRKLRFAKLSTISRQPCFRTCGPPGAFDKLMRGLDDVIADVKAGRRQLSTIPVIAPELTITTVSESEEVQR